VDAGDAREHADTYLADAAALLREVRAACLDDIVAASALLIEAYRAGHGLLICGNGGSAADAQHLATEFVSALTVDHARPAMRAIALTTDTSALTAIANDYGADRMFARQVEANGAPGDVLIAISTSGTSPNVVAAAETARAAGIGVVSLSGESGGSLAPLADVAIRVPSSTTGHIQEAHLAVEHLLASVTERALYPDHA
jgi:D-sedoheptulose 7-phosphate isomerase